MKRIRAYTILTTGLVAATVWLYSISAPVAKVEATESEEQPLRLVTLAYTVNNFGYTDTCG